MLVLSGCSLEERIYPLMELLGSEINIYNNIIPLFVPTHFDL